MDGRWGNGAKQSKGTNPQLEDECFEDLMHSAIIIVIYTYIIVVIIYKTMYTIQLLYTILYYVLQRSKRLDFNVLTRKK